MINNSNSSFIPYLNGIKINQFYFSLILCYTSTKKQTISILFLCENNNCISLPIHLKYRNSYWWCPLWRYPKRKWVEKGVAEGHQKGECRVGHRSGSSKIRGVKGATGQGKKRGRRRLNIQFLPTLLSLSKIMIKINRTLLRLWGHTSLCNPNSCGCTLNGGKSLLYNCKYWLMRTRYLSSIPDKLIYLSQ